MILSFLAAAPLLASPFDASSLNGLWEGKNGSLRFFPDHDYADPLVAEGCQLRVELTLQPGRLEVGQVMGACRNPALIFEPRLPARSFTIDGNGWVHDETGLVGRVAGNLVELDYPSTFSEEDDGLHHLRFELTPQGLEMSWIYDSSIEPAFKLLSTLTRP